ncbi:MAG: alanine--tRNA ligase [Candidatus Nanohaloarchaea archaeon]
MPSLDELKSEIKEEASSNPEKFFATDVLREKGFERSQCENCGMYFWSSDPDRKVCGEPECSGGYTFIGDSPTEEEYSYVETWQIFRDFMASRGYEPIDRYPVVARWRDDVEFVGAAIYDFQPYVVSGEAEPPAPELVVPQPSLRFNDVDNVGVTGRHYVLHDHIGQTCFQESEQYDQDRYFRDMFEFAVDELGIPEEKLILHEDSWGGGGNLGACMEFFVDGLELWNQVYMFYEVTPEGYEELDLKVLDMGMGHERITWISRGDQTSYESVMPLAIGKMKERTGLEVDPGLWEDFLPYSSYLNVDEVEDIDEKWAEIADEMNVPVEELKDEIKPAAALYSVAEHARALLFALADGKLPSNTGGGHNLRMVYRRAKDFIEKYDWELEIEEVMEWHAEELEPMFPELKDRMDEVEKILEVEEEKYEKSRQKAREKLASLDREPSLDRMIELYESHGVSPEMMEEHGFKVPEDFYARLATDEETVEDVEKKFDLDGVEETELLYYRDETRRECDAEVVALRDDWVVLDRTVFYPEGGGQEPDHGRIDDEEVVDVQKQDNIVLHRAPDHDLEKGDTVKARIQWERRRQLMQHHSTTHMVNGATRELLGDHIWQAGAHKTVEKGRLDVTHYEKLSREELDRIEDQVRDVIQEDMRIEKERVPKTEAENQYGFRIYQGGAAPENTVRIVRIENEEEFDVEACGGTHLARTGEAGEFVITGSKKVQDGVIRIEYRAGEAAEQFLSAIENRVDKAASELGLEADSLREEVLGGTPRKVQRELCDIFSVEPEQLIDTVERFKQENQEKREKAERLADYMDEEAELEETESGTLIKRARSLYRAWKENEKELERLENSLESFLRPRIEDRALEEKIPTENVGLLIQLARQLAKDYKASVTLLGEKGAVSASYHEDYDADENLEKYSDNVQGDEEFAKAFDIQI